MELLRVHPNVFFFFFKFLKGSIFNVKAKRFVSVFGY